MKVLTNRWIKWILIPFLVACQSGPLGRIPPQDATKTDTTPPLIQHIPVSQAEEGKDLLIQATIDDDSKVASTELFYREPGDSSYKRIKMKIKSGSIYMATIPNKVISSKGIEYYIKTEDQFGNISYFGDDKTPYLAGPNRSTNIPELITPEDKVSPWYKKWWVWTIIIGLAGGAAAAAGGGSGNDKGGGTGNVNVTW